MGWLHTQDATKKDVVEDIIHGFSFRNDTKDFTSKCLRHCLKGNVLWLLVEYSYDNGKIDKWIGCYLLRSDKGYGYGYKDMDESVHPYYYSCPLSYLELAPVVCEEWREGVREYHQQFEVAKTVKVGQRVKLVDGCVIPEVVIMSKKPLLGSYEGSTYRVKKKLIESIIG